MVNENYTGCFDNSQPRLGKQRARIDVTFDRDGFLFFFSSDTVMKGVFFVALVGGGFFFCTFFEE